MFGWRKSHTRFIAGVFMLAILAGHGCQVRQIEPVQPAGAETQAVLTAVAFAQSEKDAEIAIWQLLNKIDAIDSGERFTTLLEQDIEDLARQQLRFNQGERGTSVEDVYTVMASMSRLGLSLRNLETDLPSALAAFQQAAKAALQSPDAAESAFILAILHHGGSLPAEVSNFQAEKLISPLQAVLLREWLDREFGVVREDAEIKGLGKKGFTGISTNEFEWDDLLPCFDNRTEAKAFYDEVRACKKIVSRGDIPVAELRNCLRKFAVSIVGCIADVRSGAITPEVFWCDCMLNAVADLCACIRVHDQGGGH